METLKDYSWKYRYVGGQDNLIKDFLIPALERSRFYYRVAGYFSSAVFVSALKGISSFLDKGEKIFLVVGANLSIEDAKAINDGEKKVSEILDKNWEDCKKYFSNNIIKKRFELLAWMIANGKLELKIGVNKDSNGRVIDSETSKFHEKILIFEDYQGNKIQIDGSINETFKAWKTNRESFAVHKSWIGDHIGYINHAQGEFDKLLDGTDKNSEIFDLPVALKEKIIHISPKTRPSLNEELEFSEKEIASLLEENKNKLRRYQEDAIKYLESNKYVGLLEMATGTGKTFTALRAVINKGLNSKILIIGVPQKELVRQWKEECLKTLDNDNLRILCCHSGTKWKKEINRIIRQSISDESTGVLIIVYNSMSSDFFLDPILKNLKDCYIILDEVHETGSTKRRTILDKLQGIKVRIGLSATPNRMWDDYGNECISNFFNNNPNFEWGLDKAIKPPEGYEKSLVDYEYHLHEATLNKDELEKYEEVSIELERKIGRLFGDKGRKISITDIMNDVRVKSLFLQRANIIKTCKDKERIVKEILSNFKDRMNKCLVYCGDKNHLDDINKILHRSGHRSLKYYGDMDSDKKLTVFESFKDDEGIHFLSAIKCLDQGIDMPFIDSAIILTSSTNPREYIQRRGRVLRIDKNSKDKVAIIHDFLVFPYKKEDIISGKSKLGEIESKLLKKQLQRIKLFISHSKDSPKNYLNLLKYGELTEII